MATNESSDAADEQHSNGTRREAMNEATEKANSPVSLSRRGAMKTTAGLTAAGVGMGAGLSGSAAGNLAEGEFQQLSTNGDSMIVNEDGDVFKMRGVNIPDPKRMEVTKNLRGKDGQQILDMVTNNEEGWYPRAVRLPAQPQDIGETSMGHGGPEYEEGELENPGPVADDRQKQQPAQPPAFEQSDLEDYFDNYYDPLVERCAERGVYCIIDWHRHWHEQPPGEEEPSRSENHLAYDSEYTCYWAYNNYTGDTGDYSSVNLSTDDPGSWGATDTAAYEAEGYGAWNSKSDVEGTPYGYDAWQVNEELLDEAITFWEEAMSRHADKDHVIVEPYNEPTAPGLWGPAEGCGALKQWGLWRTFQEDFMAPILDTIRDGGYEGLMLVGVPGWCQSLQGLYLRDFNELGYEDVACTWHNYAGHDVSQMHNWFNDTDYLSPSDVEAETGEALTNPYIEPPEEPNEDPQACWGWEGYEAAGLQDAMDFHPIAITEFGWIDNEEVSHWLRGSTTGQGTTNYYGEPFLEEVQMDNRLSWIAWVADVRWYPTMFKYEDGALEGTLDLTDHSFYATEEDPNNEIPEPCPDLPCEWTILENPHMGQHVKSVLQEYQDHLVPFELTTTGEEPPPPPEECGEDVPEDRIETVDGQTVCDVNDDGFYRDVTGDGNVGQGDVAEFFNSQHRSEWKQTDMFDFSENGAVTHGDVVELFDYVGVN